MKNKRCFLMLLLFAFCIFILQYNGSLSINTEKTAGGQTETDALETNTEISDFDETESLLSEIENNTEDNTILKLEERKRELELENQKMNLLQIENQNNMLENNMLPNNNTMEVVNENNENNENNDNMVEVVNENNNNMVEVVNENNVKEEGLQSIESCNETFSVNNERENYHLLNDNDCNSDYYLLDDNASSDTNKKLEPNELLPKNDNDSLDVRGDNYLTATLSHNNSEIIGKPTQTHRSRLNYDLRSTPPNPQVEVSPWNISTIEPDTDRRHFEIGAASNEPLN